MIGQTVVLRTDEPTVGVGRPLKRVRVRVNDVIVPIETISFFGTQIIIELENAILLSDGVTAQYNPELVRPVANGIVAVDNLEELKAFTLALDKVFAGCEEIDASIGVVLSGASQGEVQAFVTISVISLAAVQIGASINVIQRINGQVFADASINVLQITDGEVFIGMRIQVAQNGAVSVSASVNVV